MNFHPFSQTILSLTLVFLGLSSCSAHKAFDGPQQGLRESPIEPGYLMPESAVDENAIDVLGAFEMAKIVRLGSRAIEWFELLQKDVEPEHREQLWLKRDGIGKQPTSEKPYIYNSSSIEARFDTGISQLHRAVYDVLDSKRPLPEKLPLSLQLSEVQPGFKSLVGAYTAASRWFALYPRRDRLIQARRDFRPWLAFNAQKKALEAEIDQWERLTRENQFLILKKIAEACPISGRSIESCVSEAQPFLGQAQSGEVLDWMERVWIEGDETYQSRFKIQHKHLDVQAETKPDGSLHLEYKTFQIPAHIFRWMSEQVKQGWSTPTFHQSFSQVSKITPGVIQIFFQSGALPNVNGAGGDLVTMDANQKLWQELSQVTLVHEFGHIMGFPDCYSEFWDEDLKSFTFYTLDPDNRMCALTGETQKSHVHQMRETYGSGF